MCNVLVQLCNHLFQRETAEDPMRKKGGEDVELEGMEVEGVEVEGVEVDHLAIHRCQDTDGEVLRAHLTTVHSNK